MYNLQVFKSLDSGVQSLVKWQFREHGSFYMHLWEAISRADSFNLARLKKGFPREVNAFCLYKDEEGWWFRLLTRLRTMETPDGEKEVS